MQTLIILLVVSMSMSARASEEQFEKLSRNWNPDHKESHIKSIALAVPRLGARLGSRLSHLSTGKRISNASQALVEWVWDGDEAAHDAANGVTNPGQLANSVISDIGGIARSSLSFRGLPFPRVQVCEMNLNEVYSGSNEENATVHFGDFINPALHIGITVDGSEEYGESYQDILSAAMEHGTAACHPVDHVSRSPVLVSLEKLRCIHRESGWDYSFMAYNCGGIAKDLLHASGFDYPIFPNAGIGQDLPIPHHVKREARESIRKAKEGVCDSYVHDLWEVIVSVDHGEEPSPDVLLTVKQAAEKKYFGADPALQILLSSLKWEKQWSSEMEALFALATTAVQSSLSAQRSQDSQVKSLVKPRTKAWKKIFDRLTPETRSEFEQKFGLKLF